MKVHSSNAVLMIPACNSLLKLLIKNENENDLILIGKEGGIPIFLNVMKLHASNEKVMYQACSALGNINGAISCSI